jgi:hypothetical protein
MRQLKPDEFRAVCDPVSLPFRSTEENIERLKALRTNSHGAAARSSAG